MSWIDEAVRPVCEKLKEKGYEKAAEMFRRCFASTWETTLQRDERGVFLITGDIPAMWLRDSSAQVYHYLPWASQVPEAPWASQVPEAEEAICSLLRRQFDCIVLDPYANAFNREANERHGYRDRTSWSDAQRPMIWERKYEVDSLCYPIRLAYAFWQKTGNTAWCSETFRKAARLILKVWRTEQRHAEESPYFFERLNCPPSDTLPFGGKGTPVAFTGMTWSGFRPSDDACEYGYLIPSNFFAAESLRRLTQIAQQLLDDTALAAQAAMLRGEILSGLEKYAVVRHPVWGEVYAYETDGLGHHLLMDDANVPSLLSLPYLGCVRADDPVYRNTRRMLLSAENPYYYEGKCCRGIGSPHTPKDHVWPISLCVQGLTSDDPEEIRALFDMLVNMDGGTFLMHEGVHKDDASVFTRPWFAWANSIFCEFAEKAVGVLPQRA